MIDYRFYVSNIYSWLTMSLIVASSTHHWGKCYQGAVPRKPEKLFGPIVHLYLKTEKCLRPKILV